MTSNTQAVQPRAGRSGSLVFLLLVAAGAAYAGMRWHATLERWLVPGTETGPTAAEKNPGQGEHAATVWTCGMHPQVIQDHPGDCPICHMKLTPRAGGPGGPAEPGVVIDAAVVQNMGVRTAEVTLGPLGQAVRAYAMISEAESGHRDVNLRVSGWIQTLYADTDGMEVRKGDPLFDLYSPELRLAIEELISARRAAATIGVEDGGELPETGAALVAAAESRLLALDLTAEQVSALGAMPHAPSVVTIFSPMDGHVTEKAGVYAGSAVTAGQRVFRLAQRSTMWFEARVPERELGRVRVGQAARATVEAYPGRVFEGEVAFIHPHLDEATRTALVRMVLPNHGNALHEGMYATVEIDVGSKDPVVLVPVEAVIDSGDARVVFVSRGKGRYEPRSVVLGHRGSHGVVQVLRGLSPGEQVVASGQFLLDSESRLREALAKFLGAGPVSPEAPKEAPPERPPGVVAASSGVDAILAAYLPLAETLGAVRRDDAALDVEPLATALRALTGEAAGPSGHGVVARAAAAVEAMKGRPIGAQRDLFKEVSAAVIALVDAIPPSPAVSASLYVLNCPMAKADWLQRTQEVANPYYAEEMKECGTVVRSVGGAVKGAR